LRWLKVLLSTFFFTGYFPKCPGTAASAVAFLLFFFFLKALTPAEVNAPSAIIKIAGVAFIICLLISVWLSEWAVKYFGQSDPKQFVIDEAAGMFLVLMFSSVIVTHFYFYFIAFGLFRFFDIVKK
jgi:phosphatidylglycerophosphatase A